MTNWRNIRLDDFDLTLLPMTGNMRTQIRKFFAHAQNVGIEVWEFAPEPNRWGGRDLIGERKQICKTIGDLVDCDYDLWTYGVRDTGQKTTRTVAKLINVVAGETIYTDRMLGIARSPEERNAETRARWGQVYEARKAGTSWGDIAKQFKISEQSAVMMASKHRRLNNIPSVYVPKSWQPIETAPKDKKPILVIDVNSVIKEPAVAVWHYEDHYIIAELPDGKAMSMFATHWMPLPEPPKVGYISS